MKGENTVGDGKQYQKESQTKEGSLEGKIKELVKLIKGRSKKCPWSSGRDLGGSIEVEAERS